MKLIIKDKFDAAHHLPGHPKCGVVHGHTYHIEIVFDVTKMKLQDGISSDFGALKGIIKDHIINYLDHKNLNELLQIATPPTAEHIAVFIHEVLINILYNHPKVESVTVWETESCGARYP